MKKIILTMMACAGLCACTNEEIVGPSGTTAADELSGAVAYMTVNIKDVGSSTRATDGGFAYGTEAEQTVANAYFYFYDDNGAYMARGSVASVSGTASTGDTPGNIEWESNTVVAVWGLTDVDAEGNPVSLPTKMVTVLNQPSGFSGTHLSLAEMQAALAEATDGYADGSNHFVMSTSSYSDMTVNTTTGIVNYTPLTADNFSLEPIDLTSDYGETNPAVDVYVERLAAKVSVVNSINNITPTDGYYNLTNLVSEEFAIAPTGGVYVQLLGWDINGTSRDSYMLKNIADNSNWSGFTFVWDAASNYRCYWAESPNYGDATTTYPTSSNGNTDTDEESAGTWLNDYLKYTSLKSPITFDPDSYGYCAENTNTIDVLVDNTSTGITNLLVKAQAYTMADDENLRPLDLVKFHGEYYTAKDFCDQTVSDVVTYDLNTIVEEVIDLLKADEKYANLSNYLDELNAAIYKDAVWYGEKNNTPTAPSEFDGSLLSLYNTYDGKVTIYFNMTTPPQWGDGTTDNPFTDVDPNMAKKYPSSAIVYNDKVDLDKYDFYFHVDNSKLSTATRIGLALEGLLASIDGEYYLLLSNDITISDSSELTTEKGHLYTLRNYFLRAITVQADAIDGYFGSLYPVYYAGGLMYYAIPIEHLSSASDTGGIREGQYGVVRNHWYNITLTDISDLGHGIADEDEVIVPQPEEDFYYMGATVNILSWHMINQSAGLK